MKHRKPLNPVYAGYRKLKSYRMAQLVHAVTMLFCDEYLDEESRACDQMRQAASNAVQKIVEGSEAGERSKKTELKLTGVARTSLETLRLSYEDFLRHEGLPLWDAEDPRRTDLTARRPRIPDAVTQWAEWAQQNAPSVQPTASMPSTSGGPHADAETMANGALALIALAVSLLDRQTSAQKRVVDYEANLAERLRRRRLADWPE
jgi:hypothetical protein